MFLYFFPILFLITNARVSHSLLYWRLPQMRIAPTYARGNYYTFIKCNINPQRPEHSLNYLYLHQVTKLNMRQDVSGSV